MFRVQRSVSEGRLQSAGGPAGRPGVGVPAAAASPPQRSASRSGSAFRTEQSLPPPPPRPTGPPQAHRVHAPPSIAADEPPEGPTAPEEEALTNPDQDAFTAPGRQALEEEPAAPTTPGFDPYDDDSMPTPRPAGPPLAGKAPVGPDSATYVNPPSGDDFPTFHEVPVAAHPMPPDMEDDEPETVEFAPPPDPLGPNLPLEEADPHLAGLAAGGFAGGGMDSGGYSARQSIAAKWSEVRRQSSWSDSGPAPDLGPEPPRYDDALPQPSYAPPPPAARHLQGQGPGDAAAVAPSASAAVQHPGGSGPWSSGIDLRAPSVGPRAMTGPASDAFGEFGDLDSYFEVQEDDGPDLLWIFVAVVSLLLLVFVLLIVLKGKPTVPTELREQASVARGVPFSGEGAGDGARGTGKDEIDPDAGAGDAAHGADPGGASPSDTSPPPAAAPAEGKPAAAPAAKPAADPVGGAGGRPAVAAAPVRKPPPAVRKKKPTPRRAVKRKSPPESGYDGMLGSARRELMRGRAAKALNLYEQAARANTRSPEPLAGMGWSYVNLKKPHIAVLKFQQALTKSPRYGDAYIGLGKAYRMMGKSREALRAYERDLELHPAGPSASIARNAIRSLKP